MDAEEEGGPFGIGVTLATLQQTGKIPNEEAAEILQQDEGPEPQLSSSETEETFPMGQCQHWNRDPAGAASPPVT